MRLIVFVCLAVAGASASSLNVGGKRDPCASLDCRAGRECIVEGGVAECHCIASCPSRYYPVCGSDGKTHDNHCSLHRHACLTGEHINVSYKGVCKKPKFTEKWKPAVKKEEPAVCYSSQRDAYLLLVGKKWQESLSSQPWHVDGMTFRESLWGRFYTCDHDKDNHLEADEMLNCTTDAFFMARPNQDQQLTRALCVDAILDMGDSNRDWRLDFEEFTTIFSPGYKPPQKQCSLEGRKYLDGEDVHVDDSYCICAVGSWVCTSPEDIINASATASKTNKNKNTNKKKKPLSLAFGNDNNNNNNNDDDLFALNEIDVNNEEEIYLNALADEDFGDEQFLINEDEDEEFLEDLFDDLLDKLYEHRLKNRKHHHNHL